MLTIKIISIVLSIFLTIFFIGYGIWISTGHIELMAISGTPLMLVFFYMLIKWLLEEIIDVKDKR